VGLIFFFQLWTNCAKPPEGEQKTVIDQKEKNWDLFLLSITFH